MDNAAHAARKRRIEVLVAETSFELDIVRKNLPTLDAMHHTTALMGIERDLLATKSKLSAFFKSMSRQVRLDDPKPAIVLPQLKQRRHGR